MRLAQLARKLGVKSADIVEFLAGHQCSIEDSFNAKLSREQVELIERQFLSLPVEADTVEIALESTAESPEVEMKIPPTQEETAGPVAIAEEKSDVIRAYKVALPGLKVVGKIALPEAKPKEEETTIKEDNAASPARQSTPLDNPKRKKPNRQPPESKPRKNPVALQRERQEREAREQKEAKKRAEKELRTMRYQQKVSKHTPPPKPVSLVRHEDYEVYVEPERQPAKSWLGKIAGWFVTD